MRRRSLPAVLLLVVLALAACGRPQAHIQELPTGPLTKDEYVDAFEKSAEGLAQRYGVSEDGSDTKGARVAALQKLLRAWADRLATLQPPAAARPAHDRFVAGVRSFADDLERARRALERGDEKGAERLLQTGAIVSRQTRADLTAARARFHQLGYDIKNLDKAPVRTS
jgi:hypothetical protein